MSDEKQTITIKRYASRRLYNSAISEYVTLPEIADLIREGHDVQILDKKTNEDLTRQYLLQIISDQEANGEKAFPVNILTEVIRAYKDQTQTLMPDFLSRSYEIFKEQQSLFLQGQKDILDKTSGAAAPSNPPADMMGAWQSKMSEWLGQGLTGNIAAGFGAGSASSAITAWQEQQQKFFENAMSHMTGAAQSGETAKNATNDKDAKISEMKAQLDALNKKLSEL